MRVMAAQYEVWQGLRLDSRCNGSIGLFYCVTMIANAFNTQCASLN